MDSGELVDLNVGGVQYTTMKKLLVKESGSLLASWFGKTTNGVGLTKDSKGRLFIDRDGELFRYVLDFLRCDKLTLPDRFAERRRLLVEAQYYKLTRMVDVLLSTSTMSMSMSVDGDVSSGDAGSGYITIGYQGVISVGPQGLTAADVNFRKIMRILVSGRVSLCREVFGESLNEGRDPDRGYSNDRYTARFYLKHNVLEQAFDTLAAKGYKLVTSCASGTSGSAQKKPGPGAEEDRWARYCEFVFYRP